MSFEQAAERLKAVAHPQRLQIVELLTECGEMNMSGIQQMMEMPQPTLSQHLAVLARGGWIERKKKGTLVYCRVSEASGATSLLNLLEAKEDE